MYYTGFADEASADFDLQLKATKELGWNSIETRALCGSKLSELTDAQFDEVSRKLDENGIKFNCYGSGIANWSQPITESPEKAYDEIRKAIPRMKKLGIPMTRIMSFAVKDVPNPDDYAQEVFKRVKTIVKMAEDAGILCVHENCMNWGGLSYEHTLRLLEAVNSPALKLVYDTGNPVFSKDTRGEKPYKYQSSWEFYKNVKEFIHYVHIKDGIQRDDGTTLYTFAGEGNGDVRKIVKDLLQSGYDGGFSMEPHMRHVFHEEKKDNIEELGYANYVEYGRKFMKLLDEVKAELK